MSLDAVQDGKCEATARRLLKSQLEHEVQELKIHQSLPNGNVKNDQKLSAEPENFVR